MKLGKQEKLKYSEDTEQHILRVMVKKPFEAKYNFFSVNTEFLLIQDTLLKTPQYFLLIRG